MVKKTKKMNILLMPSNAKLFNDNSIFENKNSQEILEIVNATFSLIIKQGLSNFEDIPFLKNNNIKLDLENESNFYELKNYLEYRSKT